MKLTIYLISLLTLTLVSCSLKPKELIPIYIEPYYNSQPFKINVGQYSEQLKTDDDKKILEVAASIKSNIDKVNVETLFVLSTRLYDLKKKDEASYWYYTAQFRRNVFKATAVNNVHGTESGEISEALDAYKQLLGEYINGYACGDVHKCSKICKEVIADNSKMKSLSLAYPGLQFDDSKLQEAINTEVANCGKFIEFLLTNEKMIIEKRKANGIENKY